MYLHGTQSSGRQVMRFWPFLLQGLFRKPYNSSGSKDCFSKRGNCSTLPVPQQNSKPELLLPLYCFLLWKNARAPFNLPFIPNIYDLFAVVTWGQWKGREERAKHRCIPYVSREMFSMLFNLKIKLKRRNERELIFFEYPHHTNYRHFLI